MGKTFGILTHRAEQWESSDITLLKLSLEGNDPVRLRSSFWLLLLGTDRGIPKCSCPTPLQILHINRLEDRDVGLSVEEEILVTVVAPRPLVQRLETGFTVQI